MCETMQIAVQRDELKFFSIIFAVFIFQSNFIDSESGVTIRNQLRIRRLDTWRHRARDHSTRHRPLPTYWWSFVTKPLSPAVFEILASKCIRVTTLTFLTVTWRHRSRDHLIPRYSFPIGAPLSPSLYLQPFPRYWALSILGVTTLTFQCHVTSSVTWPLDSGWVISCWAQVSISNGFRDIPPQTSCAHRHNAKSSLRMHDITCTPM